MKFENERLRMNSDGYPTMRMRQSKFGKLAAAGLLAIIVPGIGWTSSFSVMPVRVELSPGKLNSVLRVSNASDESLMMQVSVLRWTTDGEKDLYAPVDDVLLNPPVFNVPAHGTQILRLGLRKSKAAEDELAYRLIVAEVPKPLPPGFLGLRTVVRVSIPIFIKTPGATTAQLSWEATTDADGALIITAVNHGHAHIQIRAMDVVSGQSAERYSKNLNDYLLPGQKHEWKFDEPQLRGSLQIDLTAKTDTEDVHANLAVAVQ
jgi:fimbrial chaperone protein